ncbi:unnamed protein product [Cuscuta campestris]|uniref:Stress-response A/B barrel domain-containing protein n=2 Tax=Cuscuta sect. Cleistogrammica TaxID=1824901 RepID=A0A484K696_9ASTE|nr:hypothetical protein DM860_002578 [Cuscuta australis]VFQ60990.1 unnamed protein product [Cuscuta campestris]
MAEEGGAAASSSGGVVKHILLAKFKDGISQEEIDHLIQGYANLVNHIHPMKSFTWGKDVSIENLNQGFTHVFESTFESTQGVAEYIAHPLHVEFANKLLPQLEKVLVVDYKPAAATLAL